MDAGEIDLFASPWRMLAICLGSLAFVATCLWIVTAHPEAGRRSAAPGSFTEFVAVVGIVFFGLTALVSGRRLFRRGPVVSVGPRGLYDRRLSTDWIAWDAIAAVAESGMMDQRWLTVLFDPAREASLPIRITAKAVARINQAFGFTGYQISATELRGGFPALWDAVRAMRKRR